MEERKPQWKTAHFWIVFLLVLFPATVLIWSGYYSTLKFYTVRMDGNTAFITAPMSYQGKEYLINWTVNQDMSLCSVMIGNWSYTPGWSKVHPNSTYAYLLDQTNPAPVWCRI